MFIMLELTRSTPKSSAFAGQLVKDLPVKKTASSDTTQWMKKNLPKPVNPLTPELTSSRQVKVPQLKTVNLRTSWSASKSALIIDKEIIDTLIEDKVKEIEANHLEAIKISRNQHLRLRNSYILLKDRTIIRYFHKSGKKSEAVFNKEEGLVGEGGVKVVKKMYNLKGEISYVIGIIKKGFTPQSIEKVINVNKVLSKEYVHSPFLFFGKYIEWKNHKGEIKQGFLSPKMDTFETEKERGDSFREVIPSLPIDFTLLKAVKLFIHIASGLKAMHDKDWVHLDIKPGNILLKNLKAYLADFDFAIKLGECSEVSFSGTPGYIAPELLTRSSQGKIEGKSADIYSLGVTLKELKDKISGHVEANLGLEGEGVKVIHKMNALIQQMTSLQWEKRPTIDEVIGQLKEIKN